MRIGIDCRLWTETGVGRYTRNLVEQLFSIDKHNEYILFALKRDIEKVEEVASHNKHAKVVIADIRWHSFEEQLLLPQILNEQEVDLMHFPYFSVPFLYSKPFVVTIHDVILEHFSTGKASTLPFFVYRGKRIAYSYVLNHAIKKSKSIIVPLDAVKKDVLHQFHIPIEKVQVTREGAVEDTKLKNQHAKVEPKNQNYFLHVGNVYPHKNCERLVDAFAILLKQSPHQQLVFVGNDDYFMQRLKKYVVKKGLSNNVVFPGKVSDEELFAYYAHASGLILPSFMEGFGLPALEAMSQSCLVLASNIPALHEVCDDAALFFDPHDTDAIAKTMVKALQLPTKEKKDLLEKGLIQCKHFSWQQMAKETLAIYESSAGI